MRSHWDFPFCSGVVVGEWQLGASPALRLMVSDDMGVMTLFPIYPGYKGL